MKEKRSTLRDGLCLALGIAGVGLLSLLVWVDIDSTLTNSSRYHLIALAPLIVASYRYPEVGRVLGWSGLVAQAGLLLL
jgi:hypothetical protein